MEKPADSEEIQLVVVLRVLGCSQDEVASILSIAKKKVVDVEGWIKTENLKSVEAIFDDQALKRVVGRELPVYEQIEPQLLVRAGQVTADDILRHYREDYLRRPKVSEKESVGITAQADWATFKLKQRHQRDMLKLVDRWRKELAASLGVFPVRDLNSRGSAVDWQSGLHAMSLPRAGSLHWQVDNSGAIHLCYPLELDMTPETRIVRDYLHSHLRSSDYSWLLEDSEKGMHRWKQLCGRELKGRTHLLNRIERDVEKHAGKPLIEPMDRPLPGPMNWFGETIWAASLDGIYGNLDYHPVEPVGDGLFKAQYGAGHIGYAETKEKCKQYLKWHKKLMAKYRKSKESETIRELSSQRQKVSKSIHEALTKLVVDGHVPGQCDGCP